ncbi:EvpB/family type VI secretion protein [Klebsiella pneumoniae]|nr:EvpB/family type VI secretion protein [Klebsiella pneumoniae]
MSVTTENAPAQGQTTLQENRAGEGVYASLFEKINLTPASRLGDINDFLDDAALSEAPAAERLTAAMQVFMERIRQSGQRVEKLDKTLIDHHIAELDFQISRQLDAVMHHQEFQQVESLWRGLKQLVDNTDYVVAMHGRKTDLTHGSSLTLRMNPILTGTALNIAQSHSLTASLELVHGVTLLFASVRQRLNTSLLLAQLQ